VPARHLGATDSFGNTSEFSSCSGQDTIFGLEGDWKEQNRYDSAGEEMAAYLPESPRRRDIDALAFQAVLRRRNC